MSISSTNQIDSTGGFRRYNSTVDMSASGGTPLVIPDDEFFYASLTETSATAETGQTMTSTNMSYAQDSILDKGVAVFAGNSIISVPASDFPLTSDSFTLSFWVKTPALVNANIGIVSWGTTTNGCMFAPNFQTGGKLSLAGHGNGYGLPDVFCYFNQAQWRHVLITHAPAITKIYINNQLNASGEFVTEMTSSSTFYIGSYWGNATYIPNLTGNLTSIRIYKRIVTADERNALFGEYSDAIFAVES